MENCVLSRTHIRVGITEWVMPKDNRTCIHLLENHIIGSCMGLFYIENKKEVLLEKGKLVKVFLETVSFTHGDRIFKGIGRLVDVANKQEIKAYQKQINHSDDANDSDES